MRLAEWINRRPSGTGKRLEARRGAGGKGAVGSEAAVSGVDCWFRVLRREAEVGPAVAGPGVGGVKDRVKSEKVS
eukprot:1730488-Pleurochrysis_carterae.AAC.1